MKSPILGPVRFQPIFELPQEPGRQLALRDPMVERKAEHTALQLSVDRRYAKYRTIHFIDQRPEERDALRRKIGDRKRNIRQIFQLQRIIQIPAGQLQDLVLDLAKTSCTRPGDLDYLEPFIDIDRKTGIDLAINTNAIPIEPG